MRPASGSPRFAYRHWSHWTHLLLAAAVTLAAGCGSASNGDDDDDDDDDSAADAGTPPPVYVLKRASKSGTIAISGDDRRVLMVNPENGTLSIFDSAQETRTAFVETGAEPSAVVIHPDDRVAFVANRADATVVKIGGIDGDPSVLATVEVGSEPTGLALSPTGARLYVAEWAEGRISVVDTATMEIVDAIDAPSNPRAVAVTNDGDEDDDDETIVVPEFYGEAGEVEATDTSRTGKVRLYAASDLRPLSPISFAPRDSGFAPSGSPDGTPTVFTSPNQLASVAVIGAKIYVTSVSASPAAPISFTTNVQPVVYVGDLETSTEDRGAFGTANLAQLVRDATQPTDTRFFLADLVDVAFIGDTVGYVLSKGADVLQRVVYDPEEGPGITIGSAFNKQIDLNVVPTGSTKPCQNPTGVVTAHSGGRAYVNCWVTRSLGIVDLSAQILSKTVESAAISSGEADVQKGRRFYFTGRGRWANNAWSSCGSCHPDGLSDNITWVFGTGPRQTTSMDGTFSHGGGTQHERLLNWTAINDELHDFERNTRDVSGGKGALTVPDPAIEGAQCGNLAQEAQISLAGVGQLRKSLKFLMEETEGSCTTDWNAIDAFVKTIRPPRGRRFLDAASVARGAELFGEPTSTSNSAACVRCHGGPGWTVSRRFFTPSGPNDQNQTTGDLLAAAPFARPTQWPSTWNFHTFQLAFQPIVAAVGGPEATTAVAPDQIACVLRNVGTFGAPGDTTATDALEVRNPTGRAQGRLGYNVPSLYGLQLGAPYLHHGGAKTLDDLFDDPRWEEHLAAGSAVWLVGDDEEVAQRKEDLKAFILSIDATTEEQSLPTTTFPADACPASF
jgi:YVTN family beta-propeller protein